MASPLRLVTYNIHKGGTRDYLAWSRLFEAFEPDVLLVQESSEPQRYASQLPDGVRQRLLDGAAWAPAGANRWGSGVWVRSGRVAILPTAPYTGWMTAAEVTACDRPALPERFRVVSLHAPLRDGTYVSAVQRMLDVVAALGEDVPLILGGDFNLTTGVRQPGESLTNSAAELAVLERLEREFGLLNCWQAANPGQPLAQTLRWRFSAASRPYHCDGLFAPAAWRDRLTSCVVHASDTWHGHSDHYPVVATFADDGLSQDKGFAGVSQASMPQARPVADKERR